MFLLLLIYVVSSKYKVFYFDEQLWMNLSSNLTAQVRLDKQLSQFLNRESPCSLQEAKQCYETYQDESGRKRNLWLQRELFELENIDNQTNQTEIITYKNRSIDTSDLFSKISYAALGPKQSYKNTLYENGFLLCLSSFDGFLQTNYNQQLNNERSVLKMLGIVSILQTQYVLQIKFVEFHNKILDISKNTVLITQDNYISLPAQIFRAFFGNEQAQEFNYSYQANAYIRTYRENRIENLPQLSFYNSQNIDRPLIVRTQEYIEYNYKNQGYDVLKISQSENMVLGMPFLKNKLIHVQTDQSILFIQQLYSDQCNETIESAWISAGVIYILIAIFALIFVVLILWKKRRYNKQNFAAQNSEQRITELLNLPYHCTINRDFCRVNYSSYQIGDNKSLYSKDNLKPLLK